MIENIYQRLPIFALQDIIGDKQLADLHGVLKALNRTDLNLDLIHTKGFLANYAFQVLGLDFLTTENGIKILLSAISEDEYLKFISQFGISSSYQDRNLSVKNFYNALRKKTGRRILANLFGMNEDGFLRDVDRSKISSLLLNKSEYPYKPLKDYQFEVFFQSSDRLEDTNSRFILQMPTGSGKTRTAMEIICDFLNKNPNSSVVWLAHSTELCDQAADCFLQVWPHLAKRDSLFHKYYSEYKLDPKDTSKIDFLCTSFQSLLGVVERKYDYLQNRLGDKRLIVVDEAHKVVAPTYKKVTKALLNLNSSVMGLTATPGRSYGSLNTEMENQELSEFFFDTLISFNPHNQNPIEYLRAKGVLAKAKLESLKVSSTTTLSASELEYVSQVFELPSEILSKIGKDHIRNAEIINRIFDLISNQECKSIIFFATSLEQSRLINSLLNFLGIKSSHVDGGTPSHLRHELIHKFRNLESNVLCNYEVLSTGFDAPMVDCVFIARPTASVVLYSQMIGRGLRGPAIGGKEKCLIVNVRDNFTNLPSIEAMYRVFDDYWAHS
jgi:superfamily II DNA or RNA helicase